MALENLGACWASVERNGFHYDLIVKFDDRGVSCTIDLENAKGRLPVTSCLSMTVVDPILLPRFPTGVVQACADALVERFHSGEFDGLLK